MAFPGKIRKRAEPYNALFLTEAKSAEFIIHETIGKKMINYPYSIIWLGDFPVKTSANLQ